MRYCPAIFGGAGISCVEHQKTESRGYVPQSPRIIFRYLKFLSVSGARDTFKKILTQLNKQVRLKSRDIPYILILILTGVKIMKDTEGAGSHRCHQGQAE